MLAVAIYIKDVDTLEYNRIDLFDDEKISVTSSIQNINDIAKTYTDFSQTFTVPATKQNNKIFRHWYENSNDYPFSTLIKSNAYIEIDTIPFRKGKIQLESANVVNGQAQDYSITFIGTLGQLKDIFAGKYLKDLNDTTYDFIYSAGYVGNRVFTSISEGIMFPLITSNRAWNYGRADANDISLPAYPIRYNELFPAIKLVYVFDMIENEFGIDFEGTFLDDLRFQNAYLYLKNQDTFQTNLSQKIDFTTKGNLEDLSGVTVNLTDNYFIRANGGSTKITITPLAGFTTVPYTVKRYLDDELWDTYTDSNGASSSFTVRTDADEKKHSFYIETNQDFQFAFRIYMGITFNTYTKSATMSDQTLSSYISIKTYFPEIKIEDFFSGILKMFNLTCYSTDGVNYTVEQLESYYTSGQIRDITKYIKSDSVNLNRVKTYKKINFQYEKSESLVNVGFISANGVEYGSLFYDTQNDGEEYNIKLPFEDLNFNNLSGLLQVGYALKTDLQKYIPKPVILYDYNSNSNTETGFTFYTSTSLTGDGIAKTAYKPFGQEYYDGTDTYSLNFNAQQSTLTNEVISNSLYQQYYENYLANIFDSKARLIKVSGILPTSLLTTLKLNDRLIIRDKRYLINTFTTDLTTGEVQFELLTDFRELEPVTEVLIGTQTWTNRNLDVETYRDGTVIPEVTDPTAWAGLTTGAWCYYNNDSANEAIYGKLYNWYAVSNTVNGGLAPTGYHIPTDTEWTTLTTYLGGESVAGGKMKLTGTSLWNTPNTGATNSSDFTGFPAGNRRNDALFNNIGNYGYFWSFSESTSTTAWSRYLDYSDDNVFRNSYNKKFGFSIRLIKD